MWFKVNEGDMLIATINRSYVYWLDTNPPEFPFPENSKMESSKIEESLLQTQQSAQILDTIKRGNSKYRETARFVIKFKNLRKGQNLKRYHARKEGGKTGEEEIRKATLVGQVCFIAVFRQINFEM